MNDRARDLLARLHEALRSNPQATGLIFSALDGWLYALIHVASDEAVAKLAGDLELGPVERRTAEICTVGPLGAIARHTWYRARAEEPGAHLGVQGPHHVLPPESDRRVSVIDSKRGARHE